MQHSKTSSLMLALSGSILSVMLFVALAHVPSFQTSSLTADAVSVKQGVFDSAPTPEELQARIREYVATNDIDRAKALYTLLEKIKK